jgi:hypothetical protein
MIEEDSEVELEDENKENIESEDDGDNLYVLIMDHVFFLKDDCTPTTFLTTVHKILSAFLAKNRKMDRVSIETINHIIASIAFYIDFNINPSNGMPFLTKDRTRTYLVECRLRDAVHDLLRAVLRARPFHVLPIHRHATNTLMCWAGVAERLPPRLHMLVQVSYCRDEVLAMFEISKKLRYDPYTQKMQNIWLQDLRLFKL